VSLFYHLISRCVRRSWLCGQDPETGQDLSHRKDWLIERMYHLAQAFSVDIYAYSILSNHFHLVVYYDPLARFAWTDEEVVKRWCHAFPVMRKGQVDPDATEQRRLKLLAQPEKIPHLRDTLGSLSGFMKHLKQPIAWRANREDNCRGHFFESRFYSGALLSEEAVIAAMAYVDLNPIRAQIAQSLEQCTNTSIDERLKAIENTAVRLAQALSPLVSGLEGENPDRATTPSRPASPVSMKLRDYLALLHSLIDAQQGKGAEDDRIRRWRARVAANRKRQRAFGFATVLARWLTERNLRPIDTPLPA
jgi:REP element-mobilizing transposase RayT